VIIQDFRKIKLGFVNLVLLGQFGKEAEDQAIQYSEGAKRFLEDLGAEICTNLPVVNTIDDATAEWQFFKQCNVDGIVLFNGTFSLSNLMIEIIRNMDQPFLVWGLNEFLIKDRILAGSMIGTMPAGPIFRNLGKKFIFAHGAVGSDNADRNVEVFARVVRAIAYMREAKIGLMGSRPDGFEISDFDELSVKQKFGSTIFKVSMPDLLNAIDDVDSSRVDEDMKVQKEIFNFGTTNDESMRDLSKVYLGVKDITEKFNLSAFAPQCWPELRMDRKTPMCSANGRLTAEGVMASCECDMDLALTMILVHALNGGTPWANDFVNLIEENNSLLFWHCGNASYNLSDEKPEIEVVYEGPAQTASLRKGTVTICRLNHFKGGFEIFAGVGEAIQTKPMLKGSNLYVKMNIGNMEFVKSMLDHGVPHHTVAIHGDLSKELEEFARLLDLPFVIEK